MKPIVVFIVYRKYYDLVNNVNNLLKYISEFVVRPDIMVLWVQPESAMFWVMNSLPFNKILSREKLEGECQNSPTTYPVSNNINIVLHYIKRIYNSEKCYAIVQDADIYPKEGFYGAIDNTMQQGTNLAAFHWPNHCVPIGCLCTNIFAVSMDEFYWPPVSDRNNHDVLEWQWGKIIHGYIDNQRRPYTLINSGLYSHIHRDQDILLPAKCHLNFNITSKDQSIGQVFMQIGGKYHWYKRFWESIKQFIYLE